MFGQSNFTRKWAAFPVTNCRRRLTASSTTFVFIAVLIIVSLYSVIRYSGTAHADTDCSPNGVALSGSSWLGGGGVNVCNHPGDGSHYCLAVQEAPGDAHCPAGYVWSGDKWQCVEMVNRLYLTKGWTKATWYGNGNTLIYHLPNGLTDQLNGSISYVNPGDVITLNYGKYGHAGIINSIDNNGTLHIISQNADLYSSAYIDSGSLSQGNAHYHMNGWSGYTVQAIIHHPNTSPPPSAPSTIAAVSRATTHMDLFYNDGNNHLVNLFWDASTGWGMQSWSDDIVGAPAAIARDATDMDVFYSTAEGKLINRGWNANSGWGGPTVLVGSGVAGSPAAVTRSATDMDIFWRTTSGQLMSMGWSASRGWWISQVLMNNNIVGDPTVISRTPPTSMDVFVGELNGRLANVFWNANSGWGIQDWPADLWGRPAAISRNNGNDMSVYYREGNGNMAERRWNASTGWVLSGEWPASLDSNPTAISRTNTNIDTFYQDTGMNIVNHYWDAHIGWANQNITKLTGASTSDPDAIVRGNGMEVFFWNGPSLIDAHWDPTNGWQLYPT